MKYLFEKPVLSGRTARWQLLLSEFDITYVTQKSIHFKNLLLSPPSSSNQCLSWPVRPCSYLHRKRTTLSNPAFCHSNTSFPLLSRSLDVLPNCLGPAQSQDHMRTSCRCSGAVGWLVKEPRSRMPLVTSSSAVTDFSLRPCDSLSSLRYARRKNTRLGIRI